VAAQSPPAVAGADRTVGAVVTVVVAVVAPTTSCRDPTALSTPCGSSVVAAALPITHGALDERRLVGMDASDLSALASARAGIVDVTP
jgi:hypothetical protein